MASNFPKFIIVHHSATPSDRDVSAAEINRWHTNKGWMMIGYHYVVRRDGTIEKGREEDMHGAHAKGYNNRSVGICMVGGIKAGGNPMNADDVELNFTYRQWATLAELVDRLGVKYPGIETLGHRDTWPTICPGFDVKEWVANGKGIPVPSPQ